MWTATFGTATISPEDFGEITDFPSCAEGTVSAGTANGAMLGWKHRFMAAPSTMNSLAGGTPFEVAGASSAGHALVAGADLRLDVDERTALEAAYALEWGGSGAANTVSARYTRLF